MSAGVGCGGGWLRRQQEAEDGLSLQQRLPAAGPAAIGFLIWPPGAELGAVEERVGEREQVAGARQEPAAGQLCPVFSRRKKIV